jgi:hypothetical protein
MYLRRSLSIGWTSMLVACSVGVSGLQSVGLSPSGDRNSPGAAPAAIADDSGALFGSGDPIVDAAGAVHGGHDAADAGLRRDASPAHAEGGPGAAVISQDAEVVDGKAVGCPDKAACPAGLVCCAEFEDGSVVLAFDDAGGLETSCRTSCTAGTSPLCSVDADCGDAGGLCFKDPPNSARGFCTAGITPTFPTFPLGDGGVP